MKDNILIDKSIDFGARIVKLHRCLVKTKHETVLSKQVLRSGTSIGANINEAQYGNSRADFIAKLHIALKETAETDFFVPLRHKSTESLIEGSGAFSIFKKMWDAACGIFLNFQTAY